MRVAVLISGGVDSSVALRRIQAQGHEVTGFYLKIWLEDELAHLSQCPWEDDLRNARQVCEQAGVDLQVISLQRQYHDRVVSWAIEELRHGRTPSPDILCNQLIKFGAFLDALEDRFGGPSSSADGRHPMGTFHKVASGHYARLREAADGRVELLRGVDPVKDQTYFLYQLSQAQLRRCLFPLGGYTKSQVRRMADEMSLPNRRRPDSQGICFLGKIPYDRFVGAHLGERQGEIRRVGSGEVLGRHSGHWFYTIGQRKGLGLGAGPWYVVGKDPGRNVLWISHKNELLDHRRDRFQIPRMHWIGSQPAAGDYRVGIRVRHSPAIADATLSVSDPGSASVSVVLDEGDPGIAAGQSAVIYNGPVCLGGGQIHTELWVQEATSHGPRFESDRVEGKIHRSGRSG